MSVGTVARKDIADAGRSKALWAVTLSVVLFTAGITALLGVVGEQSMTEVFKLAFQSAASVLPIVALFLAKGAITGERESGSIRLLLSLPPSRRDILFGKLVGRTSLMLVAALVGGVATAVVVVALLGGGLTLLVPFIGFLCLMGISFVAVGIGISAASASDRRASAYAVGLYMLLVALWSLIYGGLQAGASWLGLAEAGSQPVWLQFLDILPPHRAALAAFEVAADGGGVFAADPFASAWLPTLVLLAWFVVPVVGGYLRFRNAEIE